MIEPDQTPVKKIPSEATPMNLLRQALRESENNINYQICEEINLFERKTGFKVKNVIITITDSIALDETDDKELFVKIALDMDNFVQVTYER